MFKEIKRRIVAFNLEIKVDSIFLKDVEVLDLEFEEVNWYYQKMSDMSKNETFFSLAFAGKNNLYY